MARIRRGLRLARQSMQLIRFHPKLLIFPIFGRICYSLVAGGFTLWLWYLHYIDVDVKQLSGHAVLALYVIITILLFGCNILSTFMSASFAGCIAEFHAGLIPSLREGFRVAQSRWRKLFSWLFISLFLRPLMLLFSRKMRQSKTIKTLISNLPWFVATFLVTPCIVHHPGDAEAAILESSQMMRQHAGARARLNYSLFSVVMLLRFAAMTPVYIALHYNELHIAAAISMISVSLITIISILNLCIHIIIRNALYHFIKTGETPIYFKTSDLVNSIKRMKKKKRHQYKRT